MKYNELWLHVLYLSYFYEFIGRFIVLYFNCFKGFVWMIHEICIDEPEICFTISAHAFEQYTCSSGMYWNSLCYCYTVKVCNFRFL